MSAFQASIAQISTLNSCQTFNLQDTSNYTTNSTSGHTAADFNAYRVFNLTYYKGSIITLSSLTGAVNPIQPASSLVNSYTATSTLGDGWYHLTLYTLPTWSTGKSYVGGVTQVYNPTDGLLYQCSTTNTSSTLNQPNTSTGFWTVITQSQISATYSASADTATICNLLNCLPASINSALCGINDFACLSNFCDNTTLLNSITLWLILYAIQNAVTLNQFTQTIPMFDEASQICGCSTIPANFQ